MDTAHFLTSGDSEFPAKAHDHCADGHLLVSANGKIKARCSLWWKETALYEGKPVGAIGHYEANNHTSAKILFALAIKKLYENGVHLAVGPLDGNTWRRYRFITESGIEPAFFLEPDNPPRYVEHFQEAGFKTLAEYFSALALDLTITDPRLPRAERRLQEAGVTIRQLDASHFNQELDAIYELSRLSFQENFLYTPIEQTAFLAQYLPLRNLIDPRLILIAECENKPVGYVFALPDFAQKQRGETMNTVILKTVACLPGRRFAGLGTLLVGRLHSTAHNLGWQRIIHALMHESNNSRNLSGHYAKTMRRYALYARRVCSQKVYESR